MGTRVAKMMMVPEKTITSTAALIQSNGAGSATGQTDAMRDVTATSNQ